MIVQETLLVRMPRSGLVQVPRLLSPLNNAFGTATQVFETCLGLGQLISESQRYTGRDFRLHPARIALDNA